MRLDEFNVLVSEIWPDTGDGWAANRGDSMANTSRLALIDPAFDRHILSQFCSPTGYLRHPSGNMPQDWKESDSTSDQCLPFYLAAPKEMKELMFARIKRAGWKTGNGDYIHPLFYAVLNNSQWKIDLCLWGQLQLFKFPYRWDDGKKWFEKTESSSCDVLNWYHVLKCCGSDWVKKKVDKNWVRAKIQSYFKNEPNVHWYLDLYDKDIEAL